MAQASLDLLTADLSDLSPEQLAERLLLRQNQEAGSQNRVFLEIVAADIEAINKEASRRGLVGS